MLFLQWKCRHALHASISAVQSAYCPALTLPHANMVLYRWSPMGPRPILPLPSSLPSATCLTCHCFTALTSQLLVSGRRFRSVNQSPFITHLTFTQLNPKCMCDCLAQLWKSSHLCENTREQPSH